MIRLWIRIKIKMVVRFIRMIRNTSMITIVIPSINLPTNLGRNQIAIRLVLWFGLDLN